MRGRLAGIWCGASSVLALPGFAAAVQRFPPPEFESGHELPQTTYPFPESGWFGVLDVAVLLAALGLVSHFVLARRSRSGVLGMAVFSLIYFGFWRDGCICAIGAVQNVSLALFNPEYALPLTVAAFFLLPIVFTLFFGRVFCAGVCPLGALQEIATIRPIKVPMWLEHALRMFPYVYLGTAVLLAATGSAFVIGLHIQN